MNNTTKQDSKMDIQVENGPKVHVRFLSLTEGVYPVERVITLSTGHPSMHIGRASKSASKNLLPAADNAWFDSPVMSRGHAELYLSSDHKLIMLRDLDSMHGTWLNNIELRPREPISVQDGDEVTFGAEVRRGQELFPACSFRIGCDLDYDIGSSSPAIDTLKTPEAEFKFPDCSDVEDEDYPSDDSHSGDEGESPVESPPRQQAKPSAIAETIDLTGDSNKLFENVQPSSDDQDDQDCIVLGEQKINTPYVGPFDVSDAEGYISDGEEYEDYASVGVQEGACDLVELHQSSQQKTEPVMIIEDNVCIFDDDLVQGEVAGPYDYKDCKDLEEYGDSSGEIEKQKPAPVVFAEDEEAALAADSLMENKDDVVHTHGHLPLPVQVSSVLSAACPQWNDSESGYLYDDMFSGGTYSHFSQQPQDVSTKFSHPIPITKATATASLPTTYADVNGTLSTLPSYLQSLNRAPSPSDAALVKGSTAITPSIVNPVADHLSAQESREKSITALGEKSGKEDYFRAREANRKGIHSTKLLASRDTAGEILGKDERVLQSGLQKQLRNNGGMRNVGRKSLDGISGEHAHKPIPAQSKTPDPKPVTEPVFITAVKRKADAISESAENELQVWARSVSKGANSIQDNSSVSKDQAPVCSVASLEIAEKRPSKKLKKFAEAMGYMALGGVTVGAGLFSLLVATAPDFV